MIWHDILFLLMGLVLIIAGGNYLTDGTVAVAKKFNISPLVIGLTVVAFGSSTPDFVISFMSTLHGKSALAVGDVIGANIFDILLVVGCMALVSPVPIGKSMETKSISMLVLSSFVLFFCGDDILFDGALRNVITRTDGLLLLCFFIIFMANTISLANEDNDSKSISHSGGHPLVKRNTPPSSENGAESKSMPMWLAAVCIAGGLVALVVGGNWIVSGGSGIALKAGISEAMVGLTIVSFGSSVPDLATSLIAAIKRQPQIALGNVIGACVFNVFFIIGTCAACKPLTPQDITFVDYGILVLAACMLWLFGALKNHSVNKWQGLLLILVYLCYEAYVITTNIISN